MTDNSDDRAQTSVDTEDASSKKQSAPTQTPEAEIGGREGPEPTRYGDWEKNGLISDF